MRRTRPNACVDCTHFQSCVKEIPLLRGDETQCAWAPGVFRLASRWDRSTNLALAVGRGATGLAKHFSVKGRTS